MHEILELGITTSLI